MRRCTRGKGHGALVKVTVDPPNAVLAEPGPRQFRVIAHYADGHERDVTRMASYKMNDDSAAKATPEGRVTLLGRAETDLIVRYQSHVVATRLSTVINPGLSFRFFEAQAAQLHRRRAVQAAGIAQGAPEPDGDRCGFSAASFARLDGRAARP